ncbi:coiled-coil domain-containing protein 33 [Osmerus mordax]|uniref:coiled-coil domain-containing protein 33 n=1 Tax=Osmerus mordax TaxID=8014 RepID=UPI00350F5794
MESISFILHGATSLPPQSDGGVPQPFAILKRAVDEDHGRRSQGVTRCTLQPTHCPSWEEKLSLELPEKQARGDVVVLNVADSRTKEILAHYRLPVVHLQPFHHYHLELVQTTRSVPHGVNLYVTVVRKLNTLPRQPHFSFTGFEVLLQAMENPLKEPVGPLFSVARIVPDYHSYRDAMLLPTPRAAGIAVTTVHFPHPPASTFSPALLSAHGRPQVSLAGSPEEQPVWNHSFLFLERDCATMFSGAAALVLEFYPTTSVHNAVSWHLRSPLGFSALSLHPQLYRKLMSERGQRGVRVGQLSLRGSKLQTTMDSAPTVSIVLRLIGSERPDFLLTAEEPGLFPSLDPETLDEEDWTPTAEAVLPPRTDQEQGTITIQTPPSPDHHTQPQQPQSRRPSLQRDGYSLPSPDALAQILPDYQHLFGSDKPPAPGSVPQGQRRPPDTAEATHSTKPGQPLPDFEDDPHIAQITDLQTKEVENYRTAMRKMAEDIITMRSQVVSLESDNSQLRSDLTLHQDLGRDLLDDTDIDVMTKAEIADRIASLKFKLASETSKASSQRDKIQQMQNDLIRKNDREKELLRLQRAHEQQQEALQSYQSRVAKLGVLETTVRQQEKVIEKMEKVLDNKLTEKNKENSERELRERGRTTTWKRSTAGEDDSRKAEIESALAAENSRLRGELEKMRQQQAPIIIQQPPQDAFPDKEKLSLLSQLEKVESRVRALETQLEENSKHWGRQKQEMLTKLSEYKCGFARTSTTILHDLPLEGVSDSLMDRRRHRQLKPIK